MRAYREALEQATKARTQWAAAIARGASFAVRQAWAEHYGLALGAVARLSLQIAKGTTNNDGADHEAL